jgi:hypothetical protein
MPDKMIRIKKCSGCPHLDHCGSFGKVANIPYCGMAGKTLPYTTMTDGERLYAPGAH